MALAIGKRAHQVSAADAHEDISARELHRRLRTRTADAEQLVLQGEVARHVRGHRPVPRHRRRDREPAEPAITLWWERETHLDRENKGLTGTTPQLTGKYAPQAQ